MLEGIQVGKRLGHSHARGRLDAKGGHSHAMQHGLVYLGQKYWLEKCGTIVPYPKAVSEWLIILAFLWSF